MSHPKQTPIKLTQLRKKINKIDSELVGILTKRVHLCEKLAKIKKNHDLPLTDRNREQEIVNNLLGNKKSDLDPSEIKIFISTILRISKNRMKKITIP